MADKNTKNPWKGLNFYKEGEILYGRNSEILSLSQYIFNNNQTILYGRSGIGKSSILNAGIFPKARQNGMIPVSIRLKHGSTNDYLSQIKEALSLGGIVIQELIPAVKGEENESLWEFMHRHVFLNEKGEKTIPLLVFDQFEEIFTLQTKELIKRDFFKQLGDLLNDVKPSYIVEQESWERQQRSLHQETKIVSGGAFKGLNIKFNVRKGDSTQDIKNRYIERPDYHIVFALREDFLSSLELYATSIPVMKDNRFGLLPLNEEQAADIIKLPIPGFVDNEVTKLIIEQVTGRTDFLLDGIPEIEVDSAVLSLYMNRLFETKGADGITADLIEQKGEKIISEFYKKAIDDIPESSVEYLEENLINGQGRRDSISVYDAIHKGGISQRSLDILCKERKILRQFHYAGNLRIEFIHDILCPIVVKNREYRQQRKLVEEESKKIIQQQVLHTKKLKRRNKIISIFACILLLISILTLIFFLLRHETTKFTVLLSEDNSINLTDYWKARVSIFSGSDTLCVADVDKSNPMFLVDVKDPDIEKMQCEVDFLIGDFVARQRNNGSFNGGNDLVIPISHNTNRIPIKGVVASRVGTKAPIYNALVIIGDQLAKTNYKGEFTIYVDSALQDSTILIRKKGYKSLEGKLKKGVYRLSLNGNYNYPELAESVCKHLDEAKNIRKMEGYYYGFEKGDTVRGKAHMIIEISGDSIRGYTYYDKSYERESNKVNSYFIISGLYNEVNNTFKLHLMDAVYNEIEYSGHITNDSKWYGETFDKNTKLGYFIFE